MQVTAHETLESTLRSVEPAVCLVPVRHLRRLLRHMQVRGHAIPVNSDLPWWVERETIQSLTYFADHVLDNPADTLLLVSDANDRLLDREPIGIQLVAYWRLLFQGKLLKHLAVEALSAEQARERLAPLGGPVVRELRFVLESDHRLHPEADDAALYRAFVVSYLELRMFTPLAVADVFPSLPDEAIVQAALPPIDAEAVLRESRPLGARDLTALPHADAAADHEATEDLPDLGRAQQAGRKGNHVRAAILYTRAPDMSGRAKEQVRSLVAKLGEICGWSDVTRRLWMVALIQLLGPAARGTWSRAARCLYELQKIPTDLRGDVYAVDIVEWMRTLGRRPIRRPLPRTRNVLLLGHLKAAEKQLLKSGADAHNLERLEHLFREAIHETETEIREELTPVITRVIEESGLRPSNTVEEVARDKLVSELLDRICARGYLRIGDIRDSIARNQLKMPDLRGPGEFFDGDPLLKADVKLAYELDGIHRRGEFYLRWIQRFSSLFFGTPWGRLLTLYLAIPFGGAFLTLMFAEELRHIGGKAATYFSTLLAPKKVKKAARVVTVREPVTDEDWENAELDEPTQSFVVRETEDPGSLASDFLSSSATHTRSTHSSFLIEAETVIGFGIFLLVMFHVPSFRQAVFRLLRAGWLALRFVLFDIPMRIWRSPAVRLLRDNAVVRFIALYLGLPILLTALFVGFLTLLGARRKLILPWGIFFLVTAAIAVNTRLGWMIQDRILERASDAWRVVRVNLIPGLIATIIGWFKALVRWVERKLYDVDESLRFRSGDSRLSLVFKAIFGLIWFPIAYLTRFVFYLLVEPQVNPVKHFPVVTVSHKVIWPMVPQIVEWTGLSPWTVGTIINGIPGIFGFIAWELKENWRLYRANRAETLKPVMIGSHGETMRGLLRPGFHSGTLPKIYRKLRRAWRDGRFDLVSRGHHDLEHVSEALQRFAERELLRILETRPEWTGHSLKVLAVKLGCQRLAILLCIGETLEIALEFENRNGRIEARIENDQALKPLDVERLFSLRDAVSGLFNLGAASGETAWKWDEWVKRWERPRASQL